MKEEVKAEAKLSKKAGGEYIAKVGIELKSGKQFEAGDKVIGASKEEIDALIVMDAVEKEN